MVRVTEKWEQQTLLPMDPVYDDFDMMVIVSWHDGNRVTMIFPSGESRLWLPPGSHYAPAEEDSPVYAFIREEDLFDDSPIRAMTVYSGTKPFYLAVSYITKDGATIQ